MSDSEIIFKGQCGSGSDGPNADDDMWDDTQLNQAYDKALRMANVEVAKRIAMATNSKDDGEKPEKPIPKQKSKKTIHKKPWAPGTPCRAIYEGDGNEYEAFVVRILNESECIVKFLGYDNTEIVSFNTLASSRGKDVQKEQIQEALIQKAANEDLDRTEANYHMDVESEEGLQSSGSTRRSFPKKAKKNKKTSHHTMGGFQLPDSLPMPNLRKLRNRINPSEFPMPPPPMPFLQSERMDEDQAVSSMLLSWYMSGYYTGLYQGMKRSKQN